MALLLAEIAKIISRERPVLFFQCHPIDRDRYIPVRGQILTLRHGAQLMITNSTDAAGIAVFGRSFER